MKSKVSWNLVMLSLALVSMFNIAMLWGVSEWDNASAAAMRIRGGDTPCYVADTANCPAKGGTSCEDTGTCSLDANGVKKCDMNGIEYVYQNGGSFNNVALGRPGLDGVKQEAKKYCSVTTTCLSTCTRSWGIWYCDQTSQSSTERTPQVPQGKAC
jgi:hypothetical protein